MDKRKWKKLSKRFACALALAMLMSANPAWAAYKIDGDTIKFDSTLTSPSESYGEDGDKKLSDFSNIEIEVDNDMGLSSGGQFDLSDSNMQIGVVGSDNDDGIRLSGDGSYLKLNNLSIYLSADNANALNLTHDARGGTYTKIEGDLYVEVSGSDGTSGIRANGSRVDDSETRITVEGDSTIIADITPRYLLFFKLSDAAAVYAGNSASRNNDPWGERDTTGHGIIEFNGFTKIETSGNGNHAIYAGKNGSIFVNDSLEITANGSNSYGIAVRNGNLSYAGSAASLDEGSNILAAESY